jgi:hypothetical protein
LLPSAFLFTFLFSQPTVVKDIFRKSGVYSAVSTSIASSAAASIESAGTSYGVSHDAIQSVATKAFPSSDIQKKSEKLIDDSYLWLGGKQQKLIIKFDFVSNTQALSTGLTDEIVKTIEAKPVCNAQQLQQSGDPTALLQTCRPADLDLATFRAALSQQNTDLTQITNVASTASTELSPQTTAPTQTDGTLAQVDNTVQGVSVPFTFSVLKNSFYIVLVLIIVTIAGMYGLTRKVVPFLSLIAHPLTTTGVLLIVYTLVVQWLITQNFLSKFIGGEQTHLTETTAQYFTALSARVTIAFGISYVIIAIIIYSYSYHQKQKQRVSQLTQSVNSPNTV